MVVTRCVEVDTSLVGMEDILIKVVHRLVEVVLRMLTSTLFQTGLRMRFQMQ